MGDGNGDFFALNAQSGAKRWSTSVSTEANKPLANNGIVYITTQAGYVMAINAGNILWQKQGDSTGGSIDGRPALYNGMLYAANDVGVIFALDAATGNQRWRYPTGGQSLAPSMSSPMEHLEHCTRAPRMATSTPSTPTMARCAGARKPASPSSSRHRLSTMA